MKTHHRMTRNRSLGWILALCAWLLWPAGTASAGIHTWDVNEVFSNADGTIQYVELVDNGTSGNETNVGNGSLSSSLQSISWNQGAVTPPTTGKKYLIATPDFAALDGAPTPDVIIDPANVPFFDAAGDTVAFGSRDSWMFASAPTNGTAGPRAAAPSHERRSAISSPASSPAPRGRRVRAAAGSPL